MIRLLTLLLTTILCAPLTAADSISKEEVLQVARETKKKIDAIEGYQSLLVKRELVDGKDTGYQYIDAKVQTEPLQIYLKFLKPTKLAGREALYKDDNLIIRRGGTRNASMILHLDPNGALAMMDNRYPITHMNPKTLSQELMTKIENELKFEETKLEVFRQAKVFDQPGTHYRMTHTSQEEGMECYIAEVMICKKLGVPIYFRVISFHNKILEEYAFKGMIINPEFNADEFDEKNPEYRLDREARDGLKKENGQG
jgi:hypothetical protein